MFECSQGVVKRNGPLQRAIGLAIGGCGWWLVENEGDDKRDVNNEQICYFVDRLAVFYVILTI